MDFRKKIDKETKTLFILWFIAIIISSIGVFSFKDIKFKNTAETEEKYRQEQLLKNLQENETNLENTDTVVDTWLIDKISTWTLTLLMPDYLMNEWFSKISEELNQQWITLNFEYVTALSDLKKILQNNNFEYDIYLIPSERANGISWENIYLWENIKPYFNKAFQEALSSSENLFIPYSLDPYITIAKKWVSEITSRWDFFSYIMLWTQNRAFWIPLIRWIWIDDINILKRWDTAFEDQFEILNQHIQQIKEKKSSTELNNLLDINKQKLAYTYNYKSFKELTDRLWKSNSYCPIFPTSCIMAYNFCDYWFWFLSTFDKLDKYFPWKSTNFDIYNFTNSETKYPVRWWIFTIPQWNDNINLAKIFFNKYIAMATDNENRLRNNTLSAVNNIYEEQKSFPIYENIIPNEDKFTIIRWDIQDQKNFFNNKTNIELLIWNYSTSIYINL